MSKLAVSSMKVGEVIIFTCKLQLFWFAVVFRYFIIAGIFPATAAVIDFLFQAFSADKPDSEKTPLTLSAFCTSAKENFRRSNQVGYLSFAILFFLYADMRIAYVLARNVYVTVCLTALMVVIGSSFLYLIPAIVRYELSLKNSFRQAFFLVLANIPNTIAMMLGMVLSLLIGFYIPVLVLIPVPLFLLANAWFSYQGMIKIEKANL
jgi:uncharacterized membrane protein YesL